MRDECKKIENGTCVNHAATFDGGHTDWGSESVCDWYAAMWVHGECAACPVAAVPPVQRRRNRKERNSA
jgi:hypothetical protein